MFKLSEEGRLKAKMGRRLVDILYWIVSQAMNAREKFLDEIKSATPGTHKW